MGLFYENLEPSVRKFMLDEIEMDIANGSIYVSNYLNEIGCTSWPDLLRAAAKDGKDDSFSQAIRDNGCLKTHVERKKPKGGYAIVAVPYTAHETMAEGEFNRFYTRGLCLYAIDKAIPYLERDEIWLNRRGIPKGEFF
ncbi:MAG: hypothetical protein M3N34_01045 [Pseudomonadota bacterium]|nr:hypothetical protein [Pseudomonadota bacterium]